jgi:acetate kinase
MSGFLNGKMWVIPTDEEVMIAQHTLALIRPSLS